MGTFCKVVSATAVGGTGDTFDSVGTIKLRPDAKEIIAFIVAAASNAMTDAEAIAAQYEVDLSSLSLPTYKFGGPPSYGQGVGTNNQAIKQGARMELTQIPAKGNAEIRVRVSQHLPDPTAPLNVVFGALYHNGEDLPDDLWKKMFPGVRPAMNGDTQANAAVTAVSTAIDDLVVDQWLNMIVALGGDINQDAAPRTAEDAVLWIEFLSNIKDFSPQEYPIAMKQPALGTAVGLPTFDPLAPYLFPAWIPTENAQVTITPVAKLVTLVTDAHQVTADVRAI